MRPAERAKRHGPADEGRAAYRLRLHIQAVIARVYGRTEDAVNATDALVAMFPDEPTMIAQHGRALRAAGRFDESVNRLTLAVQRDDRSAQFRLQLGSALRSADRFEESEQALNEAEALFELIDSTEGLAGTQAARARLLWDRGDFEEAAAAYDNAATKFDAASLEIGAAELRLERAQLHLVRGLTGDVGLAIEAARETAERFGNKQLLCTAKTTEGGLHQRRREWDEAISAYSEAVDAARQLENDELMADSLTNLGPLLVYRKRWDEARSMLVESIEISKRLGRHASHAAALAARGQANYFLGDLDAALEDYDTLNDHARNHDLPNWTATADRRRSRIFLFRGEFDRALESADASLAGFEAAGLDGDVCKILLERASQLARLGRSDAARADLERATELTSGPDPALQRLERSVVLARAELAGHRGDWGAVPTLLKPSFQDDAALRKSDTALQLVCDSALASGSTTDALRYCAWSAERLKTEFPQAHSCQGATRSGLPGGRADSRGPARGRVGLRIGPTGEPSRIHRLRIIRVGATSGFRLGRPRHEKRPPQPARAHWTSFCLPPQRERSKRWRLDSLPTATPFGDILDEAALRGRGERT